MQFSFCRQKSPYSIKLTIVRNGCSLNFFPSIMWISKYVINFTFQVKSKNNMPVISIVITLFVLAIISPWVFPNKMVSKNEHDVKH